MDQRILIPALLHSNLNEAELIFNSGYYILLSMEEYCFSFPFPTLGLIVMTVETRCQSNGAMAGNVCPQERLQSDPCCLLQMEIKPPPTEGRRAQPQGLSGLSHYWYLQQVLMREKILLCGVSNWGVECLQMGWEE